MDSRFSEDPSSFPWIITAVVSVAALYYGRVVLIPIVAAVLLTFLLTPAATKLESWHLGRGPSSIGILLMAVGLVGLLAWVVMKQGVQLAAQLPAYSVTISRKIESIEGAKSRGFGKAAAEIQQLGSKLSEAVQTPPRSRRAGDRSSHRATPGPSEAQRPVPVQVVSQHQAINFSSIGSKLGPVLEPLAAMGIVFVFAAFMLLRRDNIRDRFFTLAGLSRIHVTKQMFTEATNRVVRYLWTLACVNGSFGVLFGLALYFLGVPHALLWGVLVAVLRFIPYVGSAIGAAMPIIFSFAVLSGWLKPLVTLGVYLVLEGIIGYAVEPIVYSAQTGISALAILVAAVFWAALWGPVGLLISTPLTVCIVVVGRYIPELEFLSILLGNKATVAPEVQVYEALTARDSEELQHTVDEFLRERTIRDLYDLVFIPVLVRLERDRADGSFRLQRGYRVFREMKQIAEDLAVRYPKEAPNTSHPSELSDSEQILPDRHPGSPVLTVSCIPARDEGDEVACIMVAHLLSRVGYDAHEIALGSHREMLDETAERNGHIIYISALPPFAISSIRRLYRRIQSRFPKARVGVGVWSYAGDLDALKSLLRLNDADLLFTDLRGATIQIQQLAAAVER